MSEPTFVPGQRAGSAPQERRGGEEISVIDATGTWPENGYMNCVVIKPGDSVLAIIAKAIEVEATLPLKEDASNVGYLVVFEGKETQAVLTEQEIREKLEGLE